ncbi:helix-turn-helix domain-containing protein [Oleispirillum naphthae]|uniref:helix-turn-helix domain-containing protein n=1 Tax=Oleispirillum naphthae TaxID=2838853 RepID=UPI0030826722
MGFWEEHLASLGFGGEITPHQGHAFHAQTRGRAFGHGSILVFERTPCAYERRDKHCLGDLSKSFALMLVLKGTGALEQYGRRVTLGPGDCCLIHAGAPLSGMNHEIRVAALIYDKEVAARWLPDATAICGITLPQNTPWGRTLSAAMAALSLDTAANLPMPEDMVIEQINCLLTLAASPAPSFGGTYRESLLHRLRQILRQHAADLTFGPAACAEICGISLRTLHMTFASQGTSFCRELRGIRLNMARAYLEDPKFGRKTIAEIAGLCGYAHASHFVTSFGKAFGASPMKYRKNAGL